MSDEQMSILVGVIFSVMAVTIGIAVAMGAIWWVLTKFIQGDFMQIITQINKLSPDMTWGEFVVKFLLTFFIIMPASMLGVTFLVYSFIKNNPDPIAVTIAILASAILGGIVGFILTLLVIKIGHNVNRGETQ